MFVVGRGMRVHSRVDFLVVERFASGRISCVDCSGLRLSVRGRYCGSLRAYARACVCARVRTCVRVRACVCARGCVCAIDVRSVHRSGGNTGVRIGARWRAGRERRAMLARATWSSTVECTCAR